MLRRVASRTPTFAHARTYVSVAEPIGQGRVVPLKYESLKPVYVPKSYTKQLFVLGFWNCSNQLPNWIMAITLIWAAHGGFSGHLPPDPHALHP
ncbi:Hypothetical protein, putative [Bodo saltans]|uniref:Uncharacterized protein n=1 Tax=Bodo saltans TaxID=75058 RepID=A0A0S4ISG4_BODSA|nr:Hypothetical protein, putative [Bodo saltans]|eukprot:CUF65487.1 Hypothetical protein, putative [Bodo saltans]